MDALGERVAEVTGPLLDRLERVIQRLRRGCVCVCVCVCAFRRWLSG